MIFVDTSFWYALRWRRDRRHAEAAAIFDLVAEHPLATSNLVCGETWTLIARRRSHAAAVQFLEHVEASRRVHIDRVDQDLEVEAWSWLRRHDERPYSLVDATSFALMRKLRISEALAFDGDFAAAGFTELRA